MKVLLTSTSFQDTPGKHQDLLDKQGFELTKLRGPLSEEELLPIIANFDAVICGDDEYTEKVLRRGKEGNLKYISKYGVGLDRIDLPVAEELGIPVKNCPGVNQVSVSEHVLALLFAYEKNIHLQYPSVQQGSWKRWIGHEIEGKTIGIIGLGAVGKELAKKSIALGLRVVAFDLFKGQDFLDQFPAVQFTDNIDEVFAQSDYISLHIPHTAETECLINREVISSKLFQAPIIINTARGMLVDTDAIIWGIENGKIRAYLTDVLAIEPIDKNEKLLRRDNIIITPHVGSRTYESVQKQGIMAIENLISIIKK